MVSSLMLEAVGPASRAPLVRFARRVVSRLPHLFTLFAKYFITQLNPKKLYKNTNFGLVTGMAGFVADSIMAQRPVTLASAGPG
jgi:hypothetical protein